jgi:hypothetical protein
LTPLPKKNNQRTFMLARPSSICSFFFPRAREPKIKIKTE